MNDAIKRVTVCYPSTGKKEDLSFPKDNQKTVFILNQFLATNNAVIVRCDGFSEWELDYLRQSKTPTGEPRFVGPECCCMEEQKDKK